MQYEKSCGGVVFTRRGGSVLYVIIRHVGGHCGFPKGHMEPGETERETALREIREEVGLDCALTGSFREEECYPLPQKPGVMKKVVYFLAEFSGQEICPQPEEIAGVYLLPFEEAVTLLRFPEVKSILSKADSFLKNLPPDDPAKGH